MKNIHKYILLSITFLLSSCEQEVIKLEEPPEPEVGCISCPEGAGSGEASFDKFVTIGNSFVAGFQAGALYDASQSNSMASMIAQQLACAGGSSTFNQPDINSFNGYNIQLSAPGQGIVLGRLVLFDDGTGAAPTPAGSPDVPAPYNTADIPMPFPGDRASLNNFGVPFLYLGQTLIPDTGNPNSPYFNPLWSRFASRPGVKSIVEDALGASGSFYLVWLGIDDALLHAATGADESYPLTPVEEFEFQYNMLINTMLNVNPVFKGVVGNIPSLDAYPYFTYIKYNSIPLDAATAGTLQQSLAINYNNFLDAMLAYRIISEEERELRTLNYVEGYNNVLITDETLTDLKEYMITNGAQALVPFAQARQTVATDRIPLSAGTVLGNPYMGIPTIIHGVSWPLADQYALTSSEISEIKNNIDGYNAAIDAAISESADRLVVADVQGAYNTLLGASISNSGMLVDGVTIASTFVPPAAAFSEDGLHPNDRGYAYTANVFINAINSKFGATIPEICLSEYGGTGLPISP